MAKEVLTISEERLGHVIDVIRAGLKVVKVPENVAEGLLAWCRAEEEYLREAFHEEFWPSSTEAHKIDKR